MLSLFKVLVVGFLLFEVQSAAVLAGAFTNITGQAVKPMAFGFPPQVLIRGNTNWLSSARIIENACQHIKKRYPMYPLQKAAVNLWVDAGDTNWLCKVDFATGIGSDSILVMVDRDGQIRKCEKFVAVDELRISPAKIQE